MSTILLLTYWYPPAVSPRAFRWGAVAEQWAAMGHEVHVVTGIHGDAALAAPTQFSGNSPRGRPPVVHAVGSRIAHRVRARLVALAPREYSLINAVPTTASGARLRWRIPAHAAKLVRWVNDEVWARLYWPDHACGFIMPAALAAARVAARVRPNVLITVSHPFSCHVSGLIARRSESLRDVRWLVDIGDPFSVAEASSPNNQALYRSINRWIEGAILDRASAISVTTERTLRRYARAFPRATDRLRVVPPLGVGAAPASGAPQVRRRRGDGVVRCVYAGTLYRNVRNPGGFLRLIEQVAQRVAHAPASDGSGGTAPSRLVIDFYGDPYDCGALLTEYAARLPGVLGLHGVVGHTVARRAIDEADVVINIGNETEAQVPSKVVEYIAAGKPILNVVSRLDDSSAEFLEGYPLALTVCVGKPFAQAGGGRSGGDGVRINETAVNAVCAFLTNPPAADRDTLEVWRQRFTPRRIAAEYAALLGLRGNAADA